VLLKKDFPLLPTVKMHLHKAIPMGAGLGGGSSDAAFTLQLLNKCFNLNLSQGQLINYAAQLGSDCAFFIINKPCLATGRGEILQPVTRSLSDYHLVLVHPGIHVDTKDAFEALQLQNTGPNTSSIQEMVQQPVENWPQFLFNDFEKPVFDKYPVLKAIKKQLYQAGAAYAAMSGSGSTVFGLFHKQDYPKVNIALPFVVTRVSL
jgi:4-diphosphocytidyl-2-C-methyl-D-erythritol kinase